MVTCASLSARKVQVLGKDLIDDSDVVVLEVRAPHAGRQQIEHHACHLMRSPEHVPEFVHDRGEQVHAILLALVAARGVLGIVPWRRIDEPAPAGGVIVEPDDRVGSLRQSFAAQTRDADLDVIEGRHVDAGGLPAANGLAEQRRNLADSEHLLNGLRCAASQPSAGCC